MMQVKLAVRNAFFIGLRWVMGLIGGYLAFIWVTTLFPNWVTAIEGFSGILMVALAIVGPDFREE
jgi:hypothetical protein